MKILQNRRALGLLASALVAGAAGFVSLPAVSADNATASATAVVLTPIAVTKFADMAFGNLVAGNDDVTISTSGARTKSGTTGLPSGGTTPAAARFDVTGSGAATFSIDYTGSDSVLTSGSDTMAIAWISEAVATSGGSTGKTATTTDATGTLASGAAYIFVGAKLTVGSTQPAGTYTGVVKVTVAYN